jgi:hypothetical protein
VLKTDSSVDTWGNLNQAFMIGLILRTVYLHWYCWHCQVSPEFPACIQSGPYAAYFAFLSTCLGFFSRLKLWNFMKATRRFSWLGCNTTRDRQGRGTRLRRQDQIELRRSLARRSVWNVLTREGSQWRHSLATWKHSLSSRSTVQAVQ